MHGAPEYVDIKWIHDEIYQILPARADADAPMPYTKSDNIFPAAPCTCTARPRESGPILHCQRGDRYRSTHRVKEQERKKERKHAWQRAGGLGRESGDIRGHVQMTSVLRGGGGLANF